MSALIEPNIHPVLVHFAYALISAGVISLLIATIASTSPWSERLRSAADWMLAIGAFAIIATVAAGFQAYYTIAHDQPSHAAMTVHRNWAVSTAIALLTLLGWRWLKRPSQTSVLFLALLVAGALSLNVTAWWGGKLVYEYGLGVSSLPATEGDGHDHDHGSVDESISSVTIPPVDRGNEEHHSGSSQSNVPKAGLVELGEGDYPDTPQSVVSAFAAALRSNDETAVRKLVSPHVIIAESGGAERSLEEYASHHMPSDMAFTSAVSTTVEKQDTLKNGEMAIIITESQLHGSFKENAIHLRMMETMVLQLSEGRWRITHIHWSSSQITADHEH